jgi:putative permease
MIEYIKNWYQRHFSDPQVIILALILIGLLACVILLGDILAPVIAAVVLAYVLEGPVTRLVRLKVPRTLAVSLVLLVFVVLCFFAFFGIIPLLTRQLTQLVRELPNMLAQGQAYLLLLPERYPTLFSEQQIQSLMNTLRNELLLIGQEFLSVSLTKVVTVFSFLVYVVVVPILVFFGLKDKAMIQAWFERFLPRKRDLSIQVWRQVNDKIGSYIRGKIIEIGIIWLITYVTFEVMGLHYEMLLSFLVGISVIIPYVGAILVTFPVAIIAYFQWSIGVEFWYLLGAYLVIQILDGNVLVPILFSEVVNLHPVAIIVSILFFGGIWGVWGVFFAIPLATLIDTVINAWPDFKEPARPELFGENQPG